MFRRILLTSYVFILLFAALGCGEKELIIPTPQWAENSFMSEDGRLFVTGGSANAFGDGFIIEVTKNNDGTFEGNEIYLDDSIVFMGITAHKGYLYINAVEASGLPNKVVCLLFIAKIDELSLNAEENMSNGVFTQVVVGEFSIAGLLQELIDKSKLENITVAVANGLGIDANGYIYIADELGSRIIQCHISEDDPTKIEGTRIWLSDDATFPNGITIKENTLYFTELLSGNVKKVTLGENGEPESVQTIYTRPGAILDDLTAYKEGVIVASCIDCVVFYLTDPDISGEKGKIVFETPLETFIIPTSVSIGQPPMFQDDDIIVTEGNYQPSESGGWRVSLVKEIRLFLD